MLSRNRLTRSRCWSMRRNAMTARNWIAFSTSTKFPKVLFQTCGRRSAGLQFLTALCRRRFDQIVSNITPKLKETLREVLPAEIRRVTEPAKGKPVFLDRVERAVFRHHQTERRQRDRRSEVQRRADSTYNAAGGRPLASNRDSRRPSDEHNRGHGEKGFVTTRLGCSGRHHAPFARAANTVAEPVAIVVQTSVCDFATVSHPSPHAGRGWG